MTSRRRGWRVSRVLRVRSSTLRLSLLYLALLLASVSTLFGLFFWSTNEVLERQANAAIDAEVAGLRDRFRGGGLPGLNVLITNRVGRSPQGPSYYLLTDEQYRPRVGNLTAWPASVGPEQTAGGHWHEFEVPLTSERGPATHRVRARTFSLQRDFKLLVARDFFLLVGRDIQDLVEVRRQMLRAFGWGLAATVVLGALGSWWIGRRFARRIERINQASREIAKGDLSARIPAGERSDDLDELVARWNEMLDQIETLMAGVRHVSDNIAHDLRTPLTRLRHELEAARVASSAGDTATGEHLDRSIAEADGLLDTFSALLRIARIEAGERRAGFAAVDLSKVMGDVVELYEPVAEERRLTLNQRVASGLSVLGDRDLLFQAIANLVDNAVKYSPPGATIDLELDRVEGGAKTRVAVVDRGPGIDPENRARVFDRFFRVEESRSTPGNGLGLSLVAAVATLHGADISLEDADPGLRVSMSFGAADAAEAVSAS